MSSSVGAGILRPIMCTCMLRLWRWVSRRPEQTCRVRINQGARPARRGSFVGSSAAGQAPPKRDRLPNGDKIPRPAMEGTMSISETWAQTLRQKAARHDIAADDMLAAAFGADASV